jgi:hypothetical protein
MFLDFLYGAHELQILFILVHKLPLQTKWVDVADKNVFRGCSFLYRALRCSNFIFNFPTKCTSTIEYLNCLLNICYMFRRSVRHYHGDIFITSQNNLTISYASTPPLGLRGLFWGGFWLDLLCRKNKNFVKYKSNRTTKE